MSAVRAYAQEASDMPTNPLLTQTLTDAVRRLPLKERGN